MKRVNFYITEREIQFLKDEGKRKELCASDILRRLIDREMEKNERGKNS